MSTTIDAGGRIVIPKAMRDALGLTAGSEVEIALRDGAIVLSPVGTGMRLAKRGRSVVAEAEEDLPALTADAVRATLEGVRR